MRTSLDYSHRALAIAPSQIHFKFNIAFVQNAIAQLMYNLPESQKTLADVQEASAGLDAAIETFTDIAQSKNPPYPKGDIEQRANMGKNTMRKQLERAVTSQREYEEKHASRIQQARETREAEMRKREEARQLAEAAAVEEKRKIREERHEMLKLSHELAAKRAEEERRKEEAEYTTDTETGERYKRKKTKKGGKRKKKGDESDSEGDINGEEGARSRKKRKSTEDASEVGTDGEHRVPKRRRKLTKKGGKEGKSDGKFKSSELVVESESEGEAAASGAPTTGHVSDDPDTQMNEGPPSAAESDDDDDVGVQTTSRNKRRVANLGEEDDEEEEMGIDPLGPAIEEIGDGVMGASGNMRDLGQPLQDVYETGRD